MIEGKSDRNFDPALDLYGPDGTLVTGVSARGETTAQLNSTLTRGGTYSVILRSNPDQGASQFTICRAR